MLYNHLFHNATLLGFCITHILNTGCAKIWKKVRRQKVNYLELKTKPLNSSDQFVGSVT